MLLEQMPSEQMTLVPMSYEQQQQKFGGNQSKCYLNKSPEAYLKRGFNFQLFLSTF
jgi:hypothetical protein